MKNEYFDFKILFFLRYFNLKNSSKYSRKLNKKTEFPQRLYSLGKNLQKL